MLNKLKARKNQLQGKGGFTLVELIVVLVILAILAALLIPALTGYIDKANEKKVISETRQVVMAAQSLVSDAYAAGNKFETETELTDKTDPKKADVLTLAEVKADLNVTIKVKDGKVTSVSVTDGKTCNYTASTGKYDVPKK